MPAFFALLGPVLSLRAEDTSTEKPIETKADLMDFYNETKRIVAKGNVIVTYGETRLTADKVSVDNLTKDAYAEGHVHIFSGGVTEWHGDQVQYNFKTGAVNSGPARAYSDMFYLAAGKVESQNSDAYILRNSVFTTSEYAHPSWRWKCGSVVYCPNDKVVFRNTVLYAGDVPVFYFPYVYYGLDEERIGLDISAGQRSDWGPYVLARYRIREDKYLWPVVKLDFRARRGFGTGIDLDYGLGYDQRGRPGKYGTGHLETYFADDEKYREDPLTTVPRPERPGVQEIRVAPQRYRAKLLQKFNPLEDLETTLKIDKLSDAALLQDFFEKDLQKEQLPDNYFEAMKYDDSWTLNLLVRPQVNKFITTTERLPEISMNVPRQSVGAGIFYESESSAGILSKRYYDDSYQDFNSNRVDSFHQFTYPMKWFDWLNVVPRVGGRGTFYTHSQIDGTPTNTSLARAVFNTGVEFSTKIHQTWPGVRCEALQIDGLRHIFEPSLNYAWIPQPNHPARDILQFDPGVPSSVDDKLRPIDFPQDVGVDNISLRNVLRPMLRNRWQTKRGGTAYNFLDVVVYQDLNLENDEGSGFGNRFLSNLFWGADFEPARWIRFHYDSQYNYYENRIRESNVRIVYQYFKDWELALSHRYLHGDDANELWPSFKWRINEDWAFRTDHRFNPQTGYLRESSFALDRDLSSWIATLAFRFIDPTVSPKDYQVWLVWTLKAFPEATVEISQ